MPELVSYLFGGLILGGMLGFSLKHTARGWHLRQRFHSLQDGTLFPPAMLYRVVLPLVGAGILVGCIVSRVGAFEILFVILSTVIAIQTALVICLPQMREALHLTCNTCSRFIPLHSPWKCGHCGATNSAKLVLEQCAGCGAPPETYKCPGCEQPVRLGNATLDAYPATFVSKEAQDAKPVAEVRREQIAGKQFEIEMADLDIQLARRRKQFEDGHRRKEQPTLQQDFKEYWDEHMQAHKLAHEELEKAAKDYENNPKMRERAEMIVRSWYAKTLGTEL